MTDQVFDAVFSSITFSDDNHFGDASMMNEFGTKDARFAGDDDPRSPGRHTARRRIANDVHFGVMTSNLHSCAALNVERIAQARFAAT